MKGMFDLISAKKYNDTKKKLISKDLIIGNIKGNEIKYWKEDNTEGVVDLIPYFMDYQRLLLSGSFWDISFLAQKVKGLDLLVSELKNYIMIDKNANIKDQDHNINTQLLSMLFADFSMELKIFIRTIYSLVFDSWIITTLGLKDTSFWIPVETDET